ncbi:hypothetical protein DVH05_014676 [Phytophthora capsici]|nr:hypothetical protein DVH05_014676 [Phytophthora capsici]
MRGFKMYVQTEMSLEEASPILRNGNLPVECRRQEFKKKRPRIEETQANVGLQIQEKQRLTDKEVRRKTRLERELKCSSKLTYAFQVENATLEALKQDNDEICAKRS